MNRAPLVFTLSLILVCEARAFTGKVHGEITTQAVKDMGFDSVAGDAVVAGNLLTDKDESQGGEFWSAAAHFDNEQLAAGSKRMKEKLLAAADALDDCNAAQAREQLGRALHATQDFFAHSNWIENHPAGDAVDLLNLQDPAKDVACVPGTHKGPLTSGYYYRDDKQAAPPGKCLHNGELHKDDPSRALHAEARAKALAQTKEIMTLLERVVSARYGSSASGEAAFRIRLLKDGSEKFAAQRNTCRPRPGASAAPASPKSLEAIPWRQ